MNKNKYRHTVVLTLLPLLWVAQGLLMIGSWMAQAAGNGVNSLLSPEGLRWLFGHSMQWLFNDGTAVLWLLLTACGAIRYSGLGQALLSSLRFRLGRPVSLRQRHACYIALLVALLYAAVLVGLAFAPQGILLSATGRFRPSPFLSGLLPAVVLGILLLSLAYGIASRRMRTLSDVGVLICYGTTRYAAWLCLYVTGSLLYATLRYIVP